MSDNLVHGCEAYQCYLGPTIVSRLIVASESFFPVMVFGINSVGSGT